MKYKISEVAKMTGIPTETIRYYEAEGIVNPKISRIFSCSLAGLYSNDIAALRG